MEVFTLKGIVSCLLFLKINEPRSIKTNNENRRVENFVDTFISVLFTYKIRKLQPDDRPVIVASSTLTAYLPSTAFEISRLSVVCAGLIMAN
jgi:hypothetical protein